MYLFLSFYSKKSVKTPHLRLAVGESEDEVGDVVLSPFIIITWSNLRFSFILTRLKEVWYF